MSDPVDATERLCVLLGISGESSFAEVKRACRFARRANHPDRNPGDPFAAQRLQAINADWEQINTPQKWAAYRHPPRQPRTPPTARKPRTVPFRPSPGVLRIERVLAALGAAARWSVWLDGHLVGHLAVGCSLELPLRPGPHQLSVTYGHTNRSRVIMLPLASGERATFRCRPAWSLREAVKLERTS